MLEVGGGGGIAGVAEGRPVAVGAQPVRPPGPDVSAGDGAELGGRVHKVDGLVRLAQGQAHGSPCGGDVLEGGRGRQAGGLLELLHQLPGIQGVQEVNVPRLAVEDLQGQVTSALEEDAGRLLVGVTTVFQFQFVHGILPLLSLIFVHDALFPRPRGQVGVADVEGDLVGFVEVGPE